MNYLVSGRAPRRMGNAHPNIAPYQTFPTADGWFILAVGNDGQFRRLCRVLGLDGLAADPRFADNAGRVACRLELAEAIGAATRTWPRDALLAALEAATVPAGPINTIADVFADPQVIAREMQIAAGGVPGLRLPIRFSESPLAPGRGAPQLGADQGADWPPRA